jgi:phage repressor protein C with HTH and peptisase S24 domain
MDIQSIRRARLAQLIKEKFENSQAKFVAGTGQNQGEVSALLKNKSFGEKKARKIEIDCAIPVGWLDIQSGFGPSLTKTEEEVSEIERESEEEKALGLHYDDSEKKMASMHARRRIADFDLVSADDTDGEVGEIEYWDVRGSCGGGFLNEDRIPKGHLVKEASFFHKYNVRPEDLFSIYADGDSMADFIVDGDIVIFDKRHKEPRSGKIYAIDHPDGLKIKLLRRGIDGSWTLESKNIDKRMYPDERIELGQQDLLKVHGEFIYRQGG